MKFVESLLWSKRLWFGMAFVLLFLLTARMPNQACDTGHDLSGQMCYEYNAMNARQFGIDVVNNVGPYGYLDFPRVYSGLLPWRKTAFVLAFSAMFSTMVLLAGKYFSSRAALGTWFCLVLGTQLALDRLMCVIFSVLDPIVYLFLLLAAHRFLIRDRYRSRFFLDALILIFLALISLMKSTSLVLVGTLLAMAVFQHLLHRRFTAAFRDVGCFVAAFLAFWLFAGQQLATLPSFFLGCFTFSQGYNEVMSMYIPGEHYLVGLAIAAILVFAAANLVRLWHFREYSHRILLTLWECGILFIVWKHGFVRADHSLYFWLFILPASPLFFMAHERAGEKADDLCPAQPPDVQVAASSRLVFRQLLPFVETAAVFLIVLIAVNSKEVYIDVAERAAIDKRAIHPSLPGLFAGRQRFQLLDQAMSKNREEAAIPIIKEKVGNAGIDQYGCLPGVILLNDLNYRPRPMHASYMAVNEKIMRMNEEYYRNDSSAPSFVVAKIEVADGFFPPQEDGLAMLQLLYRYRPVRLEKGNLLLKRVPSSSESPLVALGSSQEYTWGDRIELPDHEGRMLWCQVAIDASLTGRVRSFLYKPPLLDMVLEKKGQVMVRFRFLTAAGKVGFLIDPIISNNTDLIAAYPGVSAAGLSRRTPQPDAIRFQVAASNRVYFQDRITVSFSTLEKPKSR